MSDETKHVTPDAPRQLTWWETAKAVFPNSRSMTREEAAEFRILSHKGAKKLYREEDWKAAREKAVRDFRNLPRLNHIPERHPSACN